MYFVYHSFLGFFRNIFIFNILIICIKNHVMQPNAWCGDLFTPEFYSVLLKVLFSVSTVSSLQCLWETISYRQSWSDLQTGATVSSAGAKQRKKLRKDCLN